MNEVGGEQSHKWAALDFGEREVVLRADFGERDDDDRVWTSVRFLMRGPRSPRPGESVLLVDVEGGSCIGRVESVAGWEACVRQSGRTWSGSSRARGPT